MAFEYGAFAIYAAVFLALRAVPRRYDVVQIHNPPDFLIVAGIVPRLFGARLVFDIHDFAPDMFEMRFGGTRLARMALPILRAIEKWACARADRVITVHEPYRKALADRGMRSGRVTVVMNSLDERLLPRIVAPAQREPRFRIVHHGTITPHYGVDLLVRSAAQIRVEVPNVALEVYGEGDALPSAKRLAEELQLNGQAWFSNGYLDQGDVLAQIAGASVGVVANLPIPRNELVVPAKLFEYVALGIPVVAADLASIREYFGPDEVAFFRPGDSQDLARALLHVASDWDDALHRARRARARYEAYRWNGNADVYTSLLGNLA
jgi:glycosyltransferase involved in cell wall biosynthesis